MNSLRLNVLSLHLVDFSCLLTVSVFFVTVKVNKEFPLVVKIKNYLENMLPKYCLRVLANVRSCLTEQGF